MRALSLGCWGLFFCCLLAAGQYPIPLPTVTPRSRELERRLPSDEPQRVEARIPRARIDAAQLKHDAEELAKLAQSIPSQIEKVGRGQFPKDLNVQLKRIEKLSKQLRRELSP